MVTAQPRSVAPAGPESPPAFWANRPLAANRPPQIREHSWPRTAIDRFVLAKLEEAGLSPAPPADRYTLLRRVTIDLTGLPPTAEEIANFVEDRSPNAYERVVDRLLASPAFGDRWGQHWFDLSCYADLADANGTVVVRDAWRYRDYVIASLNADKPFDRFIREQIAGDLLPAEDNAQRREQTIATGFMAIGPWVLQNYIKPQMLADVVDHQIDKIGRTFLGLSLACARCHDHKFDPVTTRDYYALAGIFHSTVTTRHTGPGVWSKITKVRLPETADEKTERALATQAYSTNLVRLSERKVALEADAKRLDEERQALEPEDPRLGALNATLEQLEKNLGEVERERLLVEYNHPRPPETLALKDVPEPFDSAVYVRGSFETLGDVVPRGFLSGFVANSPPPSAAESGRRELADWIVSSDLPLTLRVLVNRVWYHMLGAGLVQSVDDFGVRGERPSHPELLDHLALRLREENWAVKPMIRDIALSSVYRMASTHNPKAVELDPDERLLWRMRRRRLEAEVIHDAIHAVSGTLNPGRGGPCLGLDIAGNVGGIGNEVNPPSWSPKKLPAHVVNRRSVYLPAARKRPAGYLEILDLFDAPPSNEVRGARALTNVPTQALFLMNSPFLKEQARHAAAFVLADTTADDRQRLRHFFLRALGRPPHEAEIAEALGFLADYQATSNTLPEPPVDARLEAWTQYCQATLTSAEFLFRH